MPVVRRQKSGINAVILQIKFKDELKTKFLDYIYCIEMFIPIFQLAYF